MQEALVYVHPNHFSDPCGNEMIFKSPSVVCLLPLRTATRVYSLDSILLLQFKMAFRNNHRGDRLKVARWRNKPAEPESFSIFDAPLLYHVCLGAYYADPKYQAAIAIVKAL